MSSCIQTIKMLWLCTEIGMLRKIVAERNGAVANKLIKIAKIESADTTSNCSLEELRGQTPREAV